MFINASHGFSDNLVLFNRLVCLVIDVLISSICAWNAHMCALSNTGVISKLRHYLPLKQLTQIYYNLIYPYISYAIVAWGSTNKTNLHKIQTKQNHVIRLMFFATLSGKNTDSSLPLLNILEMLRWLKTVSSTFQDIAFDGSLLPLFISWCRVQLLMPSSTSRLLL